MTPLIKPVVTRIAHVASVLVAVLGIALFAGCQRTPTATDAKDESAKEAGKEASPATT